MSALGAKLIAAARRPYTAAELKERDLAEWHSDPEMFIANLMARIRQLETARDRQDLSDLLASKVGP